MRVIPYTQFLPRPPDPASPRTCCDRASGPPPHPCPASPNHVIAHAGQILHATSPYQHNRVLLQVMTLARNIRRDLHLVRQPNPRHLPQSRIRLLGRLRPHLNAHPSLLRRAWPPAHAVLQRIERIPQRRSLILLPLRTSGLLTSWFTVGIANPYTVPRKFGSQKHVCRHEMATVSNSTNPQPACQILKLQFDPRLTQSQKPSNPTHSVDRVFRLFQTETLPRDSSFRESGNPQSGRSGPQPPWPTR